MHYVVKRLSNVNKVNEHLCLQQLSLGEYRVCVSTVCLALSLYKNLHFIECIPMMNLCEGILFLAENNGPNQAEMVFVLCIF